MTLPAPVDAVKTLQAVIQSGHHRDETVARMLGEFKKVHLQIRGERDVAVFELDNTKKALIAAQAEIERLAQRNKELDRDLQMVSAAIELANREISDSENNLLKMATAISTEFKTVLPSAKAVPGQATPTNPLPATTSPVATQVVPAGQPSPSGQMPSLSDSKREAQSLNVLPVAPLGRLGETLKDIQDIMNNDRH